MKPKVTHMDNIFFTISIQNKQQIEYMIIKKKFNNK